MKTKVITGILLALFLVSMLSTTAASAWVIVPGAAFEGKLLWVDGMHTSSHDAWGNVFARVMGDRATAFAWFYVPEAKASITMKLVEVEEAEIFADQLIISGQWDIYINCKLWLDDVPGFLHYVEGEFYIEFESEELFVWGLRVRYKNWGL